MLVIMLNVSSDEIACVCGTVFDATLQYSMSALFRRAYTVSIDIRPN